MTRAGYALYLAARIGKAAATALGAAVLVRLLQHPAGPAPALHLAAREFLPRLDALVGGARAWTAPLAAAAAAHVLFGPKQSRPVYLRIPGAMYAYAGVAVSRSAGCRGGCTTGATGAGKTLCCILPRLHSLCVNEYGGRRDGRIAVPPWGGIICGEKGTEWRMMQALLRFHGRESDLRILTTRPARAPEGWAPRVRFNPLSLDEIPADTCAKLLVDTALCAEGAQTRDEFFVPQARDKIAWGLRLLRAVKAQAAARGLAPGCRERNPGLVTLLDILTVRENYAQFLEDAHGTLPELGSCGAFAEARYHLEHHYWNQPPEQLGGVRSTVYNYLVPFTEGEIAEVFCADSTFSLRDVERGTVVCLAIPQRFAVQRRYISILLKSLVYQIILERFDGGPGDTDLPGRNVIVVEQDEWQRQAVPADCDVDLVREAQGAAYVAAQSLNAVWSKLGGRERAEPLIANLRNRWICQAATQECADESSAHVGRRLARERSHSSGDSGRATSVSYAERPLLPARDLRSLPPFHVVFAPAEGPWLYRQCIAMPATPDGRIPDWWFGDWNPLAWSARLLGLPERAFGMRLHGGARAIPPWRAAAPLRAQLRWLLGLDGTFVILGGRRASARKSC